MDNLTQLQIAHKYEYFDEWEGLQSRKGGQDAAYDAAYDKMVSTNCAIYSDHRFTRGLLGFSCTGTHMQSCKGARTVLPSTMSRLLLKDMYVYVD